MKKIQIISTTLAIVLGIFFSANVSAEFNGNWTKCYQIDTMLWVAHSPVAVTIEDGMGHIRSAQRITIPDTYHLDLNTNMTPLAFVEELNHYDRDDNSRWPGVVESSYCAGSAPSHHKTQQEG